MKMAYLLTAVILGACCLNFACADVNEYYSNAPVWQARLLSHLLPSYHKGVPPTHNGPIEVKLGFSMTTFDFIDEANDLATVHGWSSRSWNDPRLQWDPESYNGTDNMIMDTDYLWVPDIELYNSAKVVETVNTQAIVYSSGDVSIVPALQIDFLCRMDLRYFPYDKQTCNLKFGSWHHHSDTINLTSSEFVDMSYYHGARDFRLTSTKTKRNLAKYECCKETYIDITYTLSLDRVSSSYSTKLVLPSVLTGFMVLATFLLPTASYEKITLCGILFLCLLLLLTYLQDIVPSSGDTILGEYLAFALFIDFFATIIAVISYNLKSKSQPKRSDIVIDTEGDDNDLKLHMPKDPRKDWLRYLDIAMFVLFTIVFVVGLAIILGRRD